MLGTLSTQYRETRLYLDIVRKPQRPRYLDFIKKREILLKLTWF